MLSNIKAVACGVGNDGYVLRHGCGSSMLVLQYRDDLIDLLGEAVAEYMDAIPKAALYAQKVLSWGFDRLHDLDVLNESMRSMPVSQTATAVATSASRWTKRLASLTRSTSSRTSCSEKVRAATARRFNVPSTAATTFSVGKCCMEALERIDQLCLKSPEFR